MLGVLFGREFAGLDVAFVKLCVLLPLLRQVVQRENPGYRADRDARATIDAFHGINVELGNAVECWAAVVIGRVLLGVDAIYGAGVDAGSVFRSDSGFGNDIGHKPPPPIRTYGMPVREGNQALVPSRCAAETWIYGVLRVRATGIVLAPNDTPPAA